MSTLFPSAQDDASTLPDPTATSKTNNPSLSSGQTNQNDAIKAVEAKLGTGATTPSDNTLLRGSGAGTSAWGALTSAQLAASITDETGTGSAAFATAPTLVTPKVDTINEATTANGVTIDGVNLKDGALNTNNSVVTANITNTAVTADKLAVLGSSASVLTSQTTASTSYTDLGTVGPALTVTVGANGILLIALHSAISNSGANNSYVSFALSGANTVAANDNTAITHAGTTQDNFGSTFILTGLTPGSTTVTMKFKATAGTATFSLRRLGVITL
jgi:hypothetical protein